MNETQFNFVAGEKDKDVRIDKFLSEVSGNKSRSYIQNLIEANHVKVNGNFVKNNYKLKSGDRLFMEIPEPSELEVKPEKISLEILYEDEDVIVINKPQGMVVHPAAGNYSGTLVNALLDHCKDLSGINGVLRPGIVHRIDKDTSGVLVVAKNDFAHNKLSEQFKEHSMARVYTALVEGVLKQDKGTVDAPLARHPNDRIKYAIVKGGKRAVTHYKVLERFKNASLIECRLETGRTHQIRVHMCSLGHPLIGDPLYGIKKQRYSLNGQLLHARLLGFTHPSTGEYMEFSSELPSYFTKILNLLRKELN